MVARLSPEFATALGIDMPCLRAVASLPSSRDNLLHSVPGVMQVRTRPGNPALDLFAGYPAATKGVLDAR